VFEQLAMKHGKAVVDQQLPLKLVAEVAMDLFAMAAVTSRATASLNAKSPTAAHEKTLALGLPFSPPLPLRPDNSNNNIFVLLL